MIRGGGPVVFSPVCELFFVFCAPNPETTFFPSQCKGRRKFFSSGMNPRVFQCQILSGKLGLYFTVLLLQTISFSHGFC